MTPEACIEELRARLQLAQGSATLLLALAESDAVLGETQKALLHLLRATPIDIMDLGACESSTGPARWAELTHAQADAFTLRFTPSTTLAVAAFARLLNAERELLRRLAGPVVLVISHETEKALRRHAPDFFTWVAQGYELPEPRVLLAMAAKLGVAPESLEPAAPIEEPIRFLHISDLHLRPQRVKRYDQDRVLDGLLSFLRRDCASFPLDLIFITGDLAQSGKPEEYALVVELIQALMEATSVPLDRVFVVPGNHDVDREVSRWLLRTLSKDEESVAFFEEPASRAFHEKKLWAYNQGMRSLFGAGRSIGISVGAEAVESVEIKGARLAVASFNSAWFAQGDDDNGKLWLGESNVEHALDRVADNEATFAIALLHHPFEFLHEVERDVVERWFDRGFDLVLRGHLHASKSRSMATPRGGFVEVAAPAAYQGSQWVNGCLLGEIRPHARTIRLRPYAYASGPDPWVLDSKVFPDDEKDGYCHTFTVPEKQRLKSAVAKRLRDAAEAAVRAASPVQQVEMARRIGSSRESVPADDASQQLAAKARVMAGYPELWSEVLETKGSIGGVVNTMIREVEQDPSRSGRTVITDIRSFERVLLRVGRIFFKATAKHGLRHVLSENSAQSVLGAVLRVILEAPVDLMPLRMPGRRRWPTMATIRVGLSNVVGIIGLVRTVDRELTRAEEDGLLDQLDVYLSPGGALHGALVLLDALPLDATEPHIEHKKTPAGRDVLLLHL